MKRLTRNNSNLKKEEETKSMKVNKIEKTKNESQVEAQNQTQSDMESNQNSKPRSIKTRSMSKTKTITSSISTSSDNQKSKKITAKRKIKPKQRLNDSQPQLIQISNPIQSTSNIDLSSKSTVLENSDPIIPIQSQPNLNEIHQKSSDSHHHHQISNHSLENAGPSRSNLSSVASSSIGSTSRLPPIIPSHSKKIKEYPRKRLFEDVDTSSQDIFSFLDRKTQPNKPAKLTRRTVFKTTQPSFLKSNNRLPPITDTNKNKHRTLASNKLLAGSQPQAKRFKKLTSEPLSKPIEPKSTGIPKENQLVKPDNRLGIQSSSSFQSTSKSSLTPQTADARNLSTSVPSHPTTLSNETIPFPQSSASSLPSPNLSLAISTTSTDHLSSEKKDLENTSTHPPPPTSSLDQTKDHSDKTNLIDLISPKENLEKIMKTLKEPCDSEPNNSHPIQIETNQDHPLESSSALTPTNSSLEVSKTNSVNSSNDNKIQNSEHTFQSNGKDQSLAKKIENTTTANEHVPPVNISETLVVQNSVKPNSLSSNRDTPMSPDRLETRENHLERNSTTPKSSPKLIPKRTSPIKHPTLPTSIPIMKPILPLTHRGLTPASGSNQSSEKAKSNPLVSNLPSMLPRRALKPTMGTSQPLTFNAAPSLDAIIEASPEKRPVRDAISAASLNRSRGFGVPPRIIFTGGIKSKAESIFLGPRAGGANTSFSHLSPNGIIKVERESIKSQEKNHPPDITIIQQGEKQLKDKVHHTDEEVLEEEENKSFDTSSTSITTQNSTTSSNLSTKSNNPQQFAGNLSVDTQDRLMKLQNMLAKMGRSESNDSSFNQNLPNQSHHFQGTQYREYEVDVKNDDDDDNDCLQRKDGTNEANCSTRSSRRRSSSVPLNYYENTTQVKSGPTRSRSVTNNAFMTTNQSSIKNQSKNGNVTHRRVSNILPSARVDDLISGNQIKQGDSSSNNINGFKNNDSSITTCTSSGVLKNASYLNGTSRRNSIQQPSNTSATIAPLKHVVAFVDVRTAEGDDAGKVFVEMLKGLGAKVVARPVFPLSHIIFKAGRQSTIERFMMHPRPKPQLVGIGWIVRCREILSKAEEGPYRIDINSSQVPFNFESNRINHFNSNNVHNLNDLDGKSNQIGNNHNRRKSMEPKALSLLNSAIQLNLSSSDSNSMFNNTTVNSSLDLDSSFRHPLSRSCTSKPVNVTQDNPVNENHVLAEVIDKARRKSLQFLPKVGSPLSHKVSSID